MATYAGIDYGHGLVNIDKATKIRYGVIGQHSVGQAWYDVSEPWYGEPEETVCPHCVEELSVEGVAWGDYETCPHCGEEFCLYLPDGAEPLSYIFDGDGYLCECDSYGDIFITKSPYFTYAQFCSPCAPGACHLESPLDESVEENRCYCLGHDWFEGGVAPYPVYSVETGQPVEPE